VNCYDCALTGKDRSALGVCVLCGAAVCREHGVMQALPQYRQTGGGIGGPLVRAPHDQRRLVCRHCAAHSWQGRRGVRLGEPVLTPGGAP